MGSLYKWTDESTFLVKCYVAIFIFMHRLTAL